MRRLWVALQILLALLVIVLVGDSIAANWAAIRQAGSTVHIAPGPMLASVVIILGTYAMLIGAWRSVLVGWDERLAYPVAARIWALSNLARYIPGRIWQIAGMAALAQQAGVSPWAAAGSAIIVQLLAIATGTLITAAFAAQTSHPLVIAVAGLLAAAGVAALTVPRATALLAAALARVTGRAWDLRPVRPGPLAASAVITALAWVAYGVVLFLFARGVLGVTRLELPTAIGAFTASYLLGLLAVFTPGGIGVREGALYLLLEDPIGPAGATVVSLGSRILMTVTEVLAALITLPLTPKRSP